MLKIYKRVIRIDTIKQGPHLESLAHTGSETSASGKLGNLLSVPAMLAGAVLGTVVFSAFFALLLIPVAIVGLRAWWLLRKYQNAQPGDQSLDAEYTVISDTSKKSDQKEPLK